jgi:hypothetical protein
MVQAIELLGTFYGDHIADIFNHTNHVLPALGIAADIAKFFIGDIIAAAAEFYFVTHFSNDIAKLAYFQSILFNKMQNQTQGCFFTNAGEFGKFVNSIFQESRRKNHFSKLMDN